MSAAVDTDNMQHQRQLAEAEARESAIYDARDTLVFAWQSEYARTGKVKWFGGNPRMELAEGETLGGLFDRFALGEVESNPEKYITTGE